MIYLKLLWGFLVANVLGYGGGPASIPLIENEVVDHYHWMTKEEFGDMLAVGNALPGPIATKIAAFVGYQEAGWLGSAVALIGTAAPSAIVLILLLKLINRFRTAPSVKGMTILIQPVIAVLMLVLTWEMGSVAVSSIGIWQSLGISAAALWAFTKTRIHPAIVIAAAFVYGGVVLSGVWF